MENATKALIIASAVLIVLVLIGVSLKVLGSTRGVTEQVDASATVMEASVFNSQFLKFEGEQKARDVRSLLNLIRITWAKNADGDKPKLYYTTRGTTQILNIEDLNDKLESGIFATNNIFNVEINIGADGFVDKITIKIN